MFLHTSSRHVFWIAISLIAFGDAGAEHPDESFSAFGDSLALIEANAVSPVNAVSPANELALATNPPSASNAASAPDVNPISTMAPLPIEQTSFCDDPLTSQCMKPNRIQIANAKTLSERLAITTRQPDWNMTIFGAVVGEMIYAEQRPVIPSAILFLSPNSGRDTPTFETHGKQSSLGFQLDGPEIHGFKARGLMLTSFYGESLLEDRQGLFIPRAFAELRNRHWRFAAGALGDIINPRIPDSLDYITGQAGGNLGAFRGQFRMERYIHVRDDVQWTLQAGMGNPITTSFVGDVQTLVEDNGIPNFEGRVMLGLGPSQQRGPIKLRPFEFGASGLIGELRRTGTNLTVFDVWAMGLDTRLELGDCWGIKAECFHGQAIGNYNAGILQIFNRSTLQPVVTTGGWAEVYVNWSDNWRSHFALGIDDPKNSRLSPGLPSRNQFAFANLLWDITQSLQVAVQIGRYQTDYFPGGSLGSLPLNSNDAMVYRTQVKFKF